LTEEAGTLITPNKLIPINEDDRSNGNIDKTAIFAFISLGALAKEEARPIRYKIYYIAKNE